MQHKVNKVIPVHKKDSEEQCSNFRFISIIQIVSKVLDRLVNLQISNHLKVINPLSQSLLESQKLIVSHGSQTLMDTACSHQKIARRRHFSFTAKVNTKDLSIVYVQTSKIAVKQVIEKPTFYLQWQ